MTRLGTWSLVTACVLLRLTPPWEIHHDCGWLLFVARRMLAGGGLYSALIEINPPLIVYLNVPPAAVAAWTGFGVSVVFHFWVFALLGCSLFLVRKILAAGDGLPSLPTLANPLALAVLAFVMVVPVGREFGQREHLMMIFTLPYFVVVANRIGGESVASSWGFAVGLWSALGFALKPQFLLAPLLVWGGTALWRRRLFDARHPENEGLILGVIGYAVHFVFVPFRSAFFANVDLVREVYSAYEISWGEFARRPWMTEALALSAFLVVAAILVRRDKVWIRVLLLAQWGFLAAAMWQGKGWNNHVFPALACGYLALVVLVFGSRVRWLGAVFVVVCLGYVARPLGQHWLKRAPELSLADEFTGIPKDFDAVRTLRPGREILVLDTDMITFFAWMVDHEIGWASRYVFLWPLPGGSPRRREALRRIVLADIAAHEPELIFVRKPPLSFMPPQFDLQTWLRTSWPNYEEQPSGPNFRLWRRH